MTKTASRGRRRSEHSHEAIITATQQLLVERSYPELTIEGIAARAGVGKQTIYRWWPSKAALVLEAYLSGSDAVPPPAESTSAREDVRALLGWLIAVLAQPTGGHVVAGLVGDLQHDADLAEGFHRDVVPARREAMLAALERGRERDEIRADADLELAVDTLHGAVFYRLLLSGESLDDAFVERLADQVLAGVGCTNTISLQIPDFTTGESAHATPSPELDASPGSGSSAECPTRTRGFLGPAGQSDPTVNL